uniref:ZP domain-containing protein n=1 Tax=Heterorhabditis bacteriophora TaxID=37862 RepID=A0A1I7XRH9_HETBA
MSTLEEWWTPYPQAPLRCITRKNKTLYVQREGGCMNSTHDLLVFLLPFGLLSYDNDIVAIPYPSDENNLSIQHERFAPSEVKIRFPRGIDEVQRVEVVTTGRIVDANYLVPTECSLISYDPSELKILKLSDKSGCGLNSVLSSFQRHFTTTGMIFSANINLSAFIHLASPRLQCSLVPCGDKCLEYFYYE